MPQDQTPQTPPSQPANNLNKQNVSNLPINKKKFIFTILVFIFFLLATSAIVLRQTKTQQSQTPFSLSQVFSTQQDCETKTSKSCIFQNCDYIPEGKTFEEVCGKNFQKGWVPTDNSTIQTDTSNWKTYSNEKLSFEFKYPSHILIPSECFDGVNLYPSNSRMPWSQYCNSPFITLVYSEGELSLEQLDQSNFEVTTEKMTVTGLMALKQTIRKINRDIPGQDLTIYVQFKNDKYFMFTLKQQKLENEFTQILSTFKFLN